MSNVQLAEWILGLVTSREQATTIVGDFTEQAAARGAVWFWSRVLRTAASITWRGVAEDPIHITGVAFTGFVAGLVPVTLFGIVFGIVLIIVGFHPNPIDYGSVGWLIPVYALYWVTSLWIGRKLARWAPDREIAVCLAYALISLAIAFLSSIFLTSILAPSEHLRFSDALWMLFNVAAQTIPLLVGAVWGRNRRLAAH